VKKSTRKRRSGERWILSAGYALPTPCAALKVPAGVSRLGAAHQPSPAYEVTRFYLATHPRRALLDTNVSHRRSTRSLRLRGVGRVHVAARRHDDRFAGIVPVRLPDSCAGEVVQFNTNLFQLHLAAIKMSTHPRRTLLSTEVSRRRSTRSPCSRGVGRVHVAARHHDLRGQIAQASSRTRTSVGSGKGQG